MATEKENETMVMENQPAGDEAKPTEPTEEVKEEVEKPAGKEEKKPKAAKKERKPKQTKPKTAAHPPYFQMIKEALLALNEKSGSSPYAIAKFMEEKHKAVLPANFKKILGLQLKNSATRGKLIKIKASYKLSEAGTKEKGTKLKVTKTESNKTVKQSTKPRTRSVNKKTETVKKGPTKVGAKKMKKTASAKPKQPKSIKSPGAKRTKKVSAA